jgi:hypothetical protein
VTVKPPAAAPSIDVGRLLDEGSWGTQQKLFVLLTALTIVFDGIDNQLLGVVVPSMMRDWALPRSSFAPIVASGMFGMMVGGAIAGLVGDRIGRRVALIGSVILFGVMTLAAAAVNGVIALAVLRFIAGLGLGGAIPNAAALASEYVPKRHRPFAVTLTISRGVPSAGPSSRRYCAASATTCPRPPRSSTNRSATSPPPRPASCSRPSCAVTRWRCGAPSSSGCWPSTPRSTGCRR